MDFSLRRGDPRNQLEIPMIRKQSQAKLLMALDAWRKAEKHHARIVLAMVSATHTDEAAAKDKADQFLHALRVLADEVLEENKTRGGKL
jgi:hypothetical protein